MISVQNNSSSWIRDDVLQVILQHRMIEELPTFFTSNYSFADLEAKLSNGRQGDETWQAKRDGAYPFSSQRGSLEGC